MNASAYTATVKLTEHAGQVLPAVFIVGEEEDRLALSKVLDSPDYDCLGDFAYYELSEPQWFVARRGQNLNLGFMVLSDQPILKLKVHPWEYTTANKENN